MGISPRLATTGIELRQHLFLLSAIDQVCCSMLCSARLTQDLLRLHDGRVGAQPGVHRVVRMRLVHLDVGRLRLHLVGLCYVGHDGRINAFPRCACAETQQVGKGGSIDIGGGRVGGDKVGADAGQKLGAVGE